MSMFMIFKVCADGRTEVKNIGEGLHHLQMEVGGPIETVRLFAKNDPLLIVNEEGVPMDLPDNKLIPGIKGDGFFIGVCGEEFKSLTSVQVAKLLSLFRKLSAATTTTDERVVH